MNRKLANNPLVGALLTAGREALKADLQDRLEDVKASPLGHMVNAALMRKKFLEEEGREPTEEDVLAWIEDCKRIAAASRATGEDECQD